MFNQYNEQFARIETTCGSLLSELQKIWDEVGEPDDERDTTLFEIEKECLNIYMRKVDEAKDYRAKLQQAIDTAKAEIADISASLGEKPVKLDEKPGGNLKEELESIIPLLDDMRRQKKQRKGQFAEVVEQLQKISTEISGLRDDVPYWVVVDGANLSLERLEELQKELQGLRNEKINRLNQVQDQLITIKSLCLVLGMDFNDTVGKIHPTLDDTEGIKDVSDRTIGGLAAKIQRLQELKIQRTQRLQDLASDLLELWHLMDIPTEEQQKFHNVTMNIAASVHEINEPNMLSSSNIKNVEEEVSSLEQLKVSKMKDLVLKKKVELEDICRRTHMITEALTSIDYSIEAMENGALDPMFLMEQIELQTLKVKDEASSRKEILEKVEKWLSACEEECWLEEYNRDDNRYNAGRGAHLALKRAEKARAVINKIPVMVDALTSKTKAWEIERGTEFLYDGERLLFMLEQYNSLRQEKEQARQRQRDQKRLKGQLIAEQEALYGSKPSPSKNGKKTMKTSATVVHDRKLSFGGAMLQHARPEKPATRQQFNNRGESLNQKISSNQRSSGSAVHTSARRNSAISGGHLAKKHFSSATKANEVVSPVVRKPLSPLSFGVSSNANIENLPLEDQQKIQSEKSKLPGYKMPVGTPTKPTCAGNEENRTPKSMSIPPPTTPSTVSAPMLMAATPATPVPFGVNKVEKVPEEVEYSFEEIRAGFRCP